MSSKRSSAKTLTRTISTEVSLQSNNRKTKRQHQGTKLAELALPELIGFQTILGKLVHDSSSAAAELLILLNTYKVNIVTVESLTGGLIASTLVDIPSYAACVYGGFVVYDSDAKREFIDVKTKSVYSQECAKQMAEGALRNSRAMCAIAVTGQSGGYDDTDDIYLGYVDIAFSIRTPKIQSGFSTTTKRVKLCNDHNIFESCEEYKRRLKILHVDSSKRLTLSPYGTPLTNDLYMIRKMIRTLCVEYACQHAIECIKSFDIDEISKMKIFDMTERDKKLQECGEPSKYIIQHMKGDAPNLKYPTKFGDSGNESDTNYEASCNQDNYDN